MWTIEEGSATLSRIIRYRSTTEGSKDEHPIPVVYINGPTLSLRIHMEESLEKNIGRINAAIDQVIHDFKAVKYPNVALLPSDKMLVVDSIDTRGYITISIKEIDREIWDDINL